jgi:hypothetical protein
MGKPRGRWEDTVWSKAAEPLQTWNWKASGRKSNVMRGRGGGELAKTPQKNSAPLLLQINIQTAILISFIPIVFHNVI